MSTETSAQITLTRCKHLHIYTDGAYFKNHNIGGWGYVIYCNEQTIGQDSGVKKPAGSLEMEMTAAIQAIKSIPKVACKLSTHAHQRPQTQITLHTDSRIILEGLFEKYPIWERNQWVVKSGKTVVCKALWQELHHLTHEYAVQWKWVKGHVGIEGNELSDQLARKAVLQQINH